MNVRVRTPESGVGNVLRRRREQSSLGSPEVQKVANCFNPEKALLDLLCSSENPNIGPASQYFA